MNLTCTNNHDDSDRVAQWEFHVYWFAVLVTNASIKAQIEI